MSIKLNLRLGTLKITSSATLTFHSCGGKQQRENDYLSMTTVNTRVREARKKAVKDLDQQTASTGRSLSLNTADLFSVSTPHSVITATHKKSIVARASVDATSRPQFINMSNPNPQVGTPQFTRLTYQQIQEINKKNGITI